MILFILTLIAEFIILAIVNKRILEPRNDHIYADEELIISIFIIIAFIFTSVISQIIVQHSEEITTETHKLAKHDLVYLSEDVFNTYHYYTPTHDNDSQYINYIHDVDNYYVFISHSTIKYTDKEPYVVSKKHSPKNVGTHVLLYPFCELDLTKSCTFYLPDETNKKDSLWNIK